MGKGGFLGETDGSLQGLISRLRDTYCGHIGVEYMDIPDKEQRAWLQERIEPCFNQHVFSEDEMRHLLSRLVEAEEFEQFLHTRYIGQKLSLWKAENRPSPSGYAGRERCAQGVDEVKLAWPTVGVSTCWPTCCTSRMNTFSVNLKGRLMTERAIRKAM